MRANVLFTQNVTELLYHRVLKLTCEVQTVKTIESQIKINPRETKQLRFYFSINQINHGSRRQKSKSNSSEPKKKAKGQSIYEKSK